MTVVGQFSAIAGAINATEKSTRTIETVGSGEPVVLVELVGGGCVKVDCFASRRIM